MRILVTGASGFVGGALIPRLLREGHEVRALSRNPARMPAWAAKPFQGDVVSGSGLERALADVEVAYYLVHSMESPTFLEGDWDQDHDRHRNRTGSMEGRSFQDRDRIGAERFALAARMAGVHKIVYLGGPLPSNGAVSRHLTSRSEVEQIIFGEVPESVALRASIVIGAHSRSFRLLVRLVERMPVLPLPAWRANRAQPIDARDVIEMLLAAPRTAEVAGRSLEIGGPEVLTYEQMLKRIADLMLLGRPAFGIDLKLTPIVAALAAAISSEDPELVLPLMESLACEMPLAERHAADLLGVPLHSFDAAVEHALADWERVEPLAAR